MEKKMKEIVFQKLRPEEEHRLRRNVRNGILGILLMIVSVLAVQQTTGENAMQILLLLADGMFGSICMAVSDLGKERRIVRFAWLIPWLIVVILYRPGEWLRGFQWWMNQMISGWNQTYDSGLALYQVQSGVRDQAAITFILVFLCAEVSWKLVSENRTFFCAIFCLGLIVLQLVSGGTQLQNAIWLLFVLLSLLLSEGESWPTGRTVFWEAGIFLFVLICSIGMSQREMESVAEFRNQAQEQVHEWRYGEQMLPKGDLTKASKLKESTEEMMTVQSEQEKSLYFRGFSGGRYDSTTGKWYALTDADYGNENNGIFRWLKRRGFDPLTQVADYYRLGDESQQPEANELRISIANAECEYYYLPCSLEKVTEGSAKEVKDTGLRSKGLVGERSYKLREVSGSRPFELMMAEGWITNPQNEAQKQYLEAEAVYRNFVYEQELDVDENLRDLIRKIFWDDYTTQQDGIYSALSQIRTVLKNPAYYAKNAGIGEEDSDPVSWFLTGDHNGNAMYYASAAVLAFRVYGIPARYAEGYYISDSMAQEQGSQVTVTGQNAHAWVEVYFDGIGWLPVDVTPGYYYESVELQEMVSLPDTIQKTAAVENNQPEAEQISGEKGKQMSLPEKAVKYSIYLLLGLFTILVILLTAAIAGTETLRWIWNWKIRKNYRQADQKEKVQILHRLLYRVLAIRGITGKLGWKMEETDQELAEKIEGIEPGMYSKVCGILEKSIFGEIDLEVYEERIIRTFLEKAAHLEKNDSLRLKLQMRYKIIMEK